MLISPIAFAAGAAGWTFAEYAMHRWSGHKKPDPKRKNSKGALLSGDFGPEHRAHHADTTYFAPTKYKVRAALLLIPTLGGAASLLLGPRRGVSFALGFATMYAGYEIVHRRTHTHAPSNAYGRWARKHHLSHHFNAKYNHGVTTDIWDRVFGTYKKFDKVRVPPRIVQHWMVDEDGNMKAEFADDYELMGQGKRRSEAVNTAKAAAA